MISARDEEMLLEKLKRLERDLKATGHDIKLTWKPFTVANDDVAPDAYPGIWVLVTRGQSSCGAFSSFAPPDEQGFLIEIADQFQEFMAQDLGPWPKCPICGRPLQAALNDESWWICDRDTNIRVPIGELNRLVTRNH